MSVAIIAAIIFLGVYGFCYFIQRALELIDAEDERN